MSAVIAPEVIDVALRPAVAFPMFGLWLLVALYVYERTGSRLGGVLVLPFLVLYTLHDVVALPVFAIAAVLSYATGEALQRWTLLYGRRLLVGFLLTSLLFSGLLQVVLPVDFETIFLPILPGLFAYNLHREGRPLWGALVFTGWLLVALVVTVAIVRLLRLTVLAGG